MRGEEPEREMDEMEWYWIVAIAVGGAIVLGAAITTLIELPAVRRYMRLKSM